MKKNFNLYTLTEREQQEAKGGYCGCGCVWVNCGGSSAMDNGIANIKGGLVSPQYLPHDSSGGLET